MVGGPQRGVRVSVSPPPFVTQFIPLKYQYPLLNMVLGLSDLLPKMCALAVNMAPDLRSEYEFAWESHTQKGGIPDDA